LPSACGEGYVAPITPLRSVLLLALAAGIVAAGAFLTNSPVRADSTSYRDAILGTGGLVSYWRLGDASGPTATDEKGTNPGTYQSGATLGQPGAIVDDPDTAAGFNGVGAQVHTPFAPKGSAGTVEFWGYATAIDRRNAIMYTADDGTASYSHQVGVQADGAVRGYVWDGAARIPRSPAGKVQPNEWHHYALTWQDNDSVRLYLDGQLQGSVPLGTAFTQGDKFLIGRRGGSASKLTNAWQGRLDEVAVYDSALPAATLQAHHDTGIADKAAPDAPTGLTATAGDGSVSLNWNDNGEDDLDGYDVYRSTSPGGPYTKVNAARLQDSHYSDTTVTNGTTYHYVVRATDTTGNESASSGEVSATPVGDAYPDVITGTGGLVSYWRLGEGSGAAAADQTGANPGTYQGGVTLGQPGAIIDDPDTAVGFDGVSGLVSTPFAPSANAGTIEFWGFATALDRRNAAVYTADDGTTSYTHQVGVQHDGAVRAYLHDGTQRRVAGPAGAVKPGEWHHYALTWQDNEAARLYLDGNLQGSVPLASAWKGGNKFLIGKAGGSASRLVKPWQGRLDEFAVYNTALTAATLREHHAAGVGTELPEDLQISAQPSLYPEFDPQVTDYVSRCEPANSVQLSVTAPAGTSVSVDGESPQTGSFTEDVAVTAGQRFSFAVQESGGSSSTYHVRCLPSNFPGFTSQRPGGTQSEWYIVTPSIMSNFGPPPSNTSARYVAVFDSNGVPMWWMLSRDDTGPVDAKLQPNGNIGWLHFNLPDYEEHALDGTLVRTLQTHGPGSDFHDIQLLSNGNYLMAKYYLRGGVDLSACGGPSNAIIQDNQLQEVTPSGALVWSWTAYDHIPVSELSPKWSDQCTNNTGGVTPGGNGGGDIYHFNSMEADGDGIVISLRHEDAVYRIDKATGAVDWKIGGTTTTQSLTVQGDAAMSLGGGFGGQHDARILPDGTLTVHDNGTRRSRPPRAVRYSVNEGANTATLLEEITDPDAPGSLCCGGSRKLPGGNWVMEWGQNPFVTELTPSGARRFKLIFTQGLFSYRANPVTFGTMSRTALRSGMDTMYPR
jgi:hypothetical protein